MQVDINLLASYESRGLLSANRHQTEDLIIWCYTPECTFDHKNWDDVTKQCRGLITNSAGEVIQRPFYKFFNHTDSFREEIGEYFNPDFTDAIIQEKMDGSLGILYWATGNDKCPDSMKGRLIPHIATKASFTSDQAIQGSTMIRLSFLLKSLGSLISPNHYELGRMDTSMQYEIFNPESVFTHLFEIIYPENRIVVDYKGKRSLVYLGSIHKDTGEFKIFPNQPFTYAKTYTQVEFERYVNTQPPGTEMEGFVVTFANGKRLKYKFEDYKRLHIVLTGLNDRGIWQMLMEKRNLATELAAIPDEAYDKITNYANKLLAEYKEIEETANILYTTVKTLPSRKEQALSLFKEVKKLGLSNDFAAIVFKKLDGKSYELNIWEMIQPKGTKNYLEEGKNE